MDVIDTTKEIGRALPGARLDHIRISGYMQPQYQVASDTGISSFNGGDFPSNSNNRFMLRRGRIRFDYARTYPDGRNRFQFVFQFDGTERGVFIRDFWGRYWEHKLQLFALTTGMFARPFGFEINYSSSDRESPERGRMSQILMRTERDLGAMVTFEDRKRRTGLQFLKIDLGVFNGQGLTATEDFDRYKDIIGQLQVKSRKIGKSMSIAGGVSFLHGGIIQSAPFTYKLDEGRNMTRFVADSTGHRVGGKLPRRYYGTNAQYQWKHSWGSTILRAEYWEGTQTGNAFNSFTPDRIVDELSGQAIPFAIRPFRGGFFYYLQHLGSPEHQILFKYDFYDPNTKVAGQEVSAAGNFSQADIRYQTLGMGYVYYMSENFKLTLWYDRVRNEKTAIPGFGEDVKDNIFTARLQFRF